MVTTEMESCGSIRIHVTPPKGLKTTILHLLFGIIFTRRSLPFERFRTCDVAHVHDIIRNKQSL